MKPLAARTPEFVNPFSYASYRELMTKLVHQHKTTGDDQTSDRIAFTRLNLQRMKRVEKQLYILPEIKDLLAQHQPQWHWVALVESWCGDGAHLLPAIAGISALAPAIKLTVLQRDQNPAWMDCCLTNGTRSIPKLLCLDANLQDVLFTWGPRPAYIHKKYLAYRAQHPELTTEKAVMQLQCWYTQDRSKALQQDLLALMEQELLFASEEMLIAG